jgi:predicted lipase
MIFFQTKSAQKFFLGWSIFALMTSCQIVPVAKPKEQDSTILESDRDPSVLPEETEGITFEFCPSQRGFSLTHSLWMTYFSALEYAHFKHAAPELRRHGFGSEEDSRTWVRAWYTLRIKRVSENQKNSDDTWKSEVERSQRMEILKDEYLRLFGEQYQDNGQESGQYEYDLVSGKNPTKSIQFLSSFLDKNGTPSKGATQALYTEHSSMPLALIILRGSEADEPRDIATDLNIIHSNFGNKGSVHSGFYQHILNIWPQLEKVLRERSGILERENKKIHLWLGGHSLGGAAVTILSSLIMDLKDSGAIPAIELTGVYSMGSPRVGNRTFMETIHAQAARNNVAIYRIRNGRDMITGIPVSGPFGGEGYRHVGALIYITQNGELSYGNGNKTVENSSDYLKTSTDSFKDHPVKAYWQRIKSLFLKSRQNNTSQGCSQEATEPLQPFIESQSLQGSEPNSNFHL